MLVEAFLLLGNPWQSFNVPRQQNSNSPPVRSLYELYRPRFCRGAARIRLTYVDHRRRQRHPTPVLLPGKSHGWRSLVSCSPWGREESDTTERLHFHFSLSCIGEGNGNPLQCSCLENLRDGEAWWAAVYGIARSRTRLKRLSSSSSSRAPIWTRTRIQDLLVSDELREW